MITHVEHVMGTAVSVTVDPGSGDPAAAIADACAVLHAADETFSTFKAGSVISRHRRGELRAEELPADMLEVLELSARAARLTGGFFDPWAMPGGFDPTGLVKGWAAQRAVGCLRDGGVAAAMVNAGGDVACFGPVPWRIGVRDPGARSGWSALPTSPRRSPQSGGYERPGELSTRATASRPATAGPGDRRGRRSRAGRRLRDGAVVRGEPASRWSTRHPATRRSSSRSDGRMLATPGFPIAAAAAA